VQLLRPSVAVILPCGQFEQEVAFAPDFLPAGQAVHVAEPIVENLPAVQSLHFVCAVSSLKVPAGHRVQEADALAEYLPVGQLTQDEAPAAEYLPASQSSQMPPLCAYRPAPHCPHPADPAADVCPLAQSVH
jgi:hypothetical protein